MCTRAVSKHVHLIDAPYSGKSGVLGTYLVKGELSMIVDPGPTVSIPYVIQELEDEGLSSNLSGFVAPTHIHLDHAGGSWKLMERYPMTNLLVHPRGASHMVDPSKLEAGARQLFGDAVSGYGEIRGAPAERVMESQHDQEFDLRGVTVKVIWTPGHASHHQCYFVPKDRVMILGDAGGFFSPETGIIMPTTPPPFNPLQAISSLDALIALEPETVCYGHFGYAGEAVEKLEAHKRQIRLWSRIVENGSENGKNPREIYEQIRSEDPMASRMVYSPEKTERSPVVSIMGFLKYHEWARSKEKS
uniref:Beta-lactamase domain protein n=1 Tax=uncultured marine crenarchaeote E6-3G TaxID=907719 RepID=G9BAK3_9ARCH|nr:beta-lactamase domain protein [uncultured marine crenarchaeote E6-3G]